MEKIEEVINVVTNRKRNIVITSLVLFIIGYIVGFVSIKLA